jgi:hypothetical protein
MLVSGIAHQLLMPLARQQETAVAGSRMAQAWYVTHGKPTMKAGTAIGQDGTVHSWSCMDSLTAASIM